ncbi:MAG: glycosyltransferase family 2 protein [Minisyncoccia bacterium]
MIFTNYSQLTKQIQQKLKNTKEYTKNIPIFINTRDRVNCLQQQIDWLAKAGYTNIVIIDNASTYPKLIDFLKKCPYPVIRLKKNLGHTALWQIKEIRPVIIEEWFVYTDPDVIPIEVCPYDVLTYFYEILKRHSDYLKIGLGLLLSDIPDHYHLKSSVIRWENNLYGKEIEPNVFEADVDTTFALYRPRTPYCVAPALRTLGQYQARHLPWYIDSQNIDEEEQYYRDHATKSITHWNTSGVSKHETLSLRGGQTAIWSNDPEKIFRNLVNSKTWEVNSFLRFFRHLYSKSDKINIYSKNLSQKQLKDELLKFITSDDWYYTWLFKEKIRRIRNNLPFFKK